MSDEDPKFVWILAYMVALHAEASKPRHESYTTQQPPVSGHGGVAVWGGGTINRTETSDAAAAARAADLAVEHFNKFQKQVEGR